MPVEASKSCSASALQPIEERPVRHLLRALFLSPCALLAACYIQPSPGYQYGPQPITPVYQGADPGIGYQTGPVGYGAPELVALPGTSIYVAPAFTTDLFFTDGYWWRPYNGGWYRSAYYDRGWVQYGGVPAWYRGVPNNWRYNYNHHQWNGHPWDYKRVQAGAPGGPNGRYGGARFEGQQPQQPQQHNRPQPQVRNQPQQFNGGSPQEHNRHQQQFHVSDASNVNTQSHKKKLNNN